MKHKYKISALTASILASFVATPLYAAEPEKKEESDVEVIEVKGFRGSLQRAVNAKRFSDSVSDSIHAEDVGKSTDQNIADALSRVTGISVQEEDGEGTRISIRGTNPAMNQISMNGVALTGGLSNDGQDGATQDNSVDLSTFSSDILASIDVVKTASADQDEGSLGGSVRLRSVKPLALREDRRSLTAEHRYNEFSGEQDSRFVGSFSQKLFNDSFGFIVTASHDNQKTRQDRINTDFVSGAWQIDDWGTGSRNATNMAGEQIRVAPYQRISGATTGDVYDSNGNALTYLDENGALVEGMENQIIYDANGTPLYNIPDGLDPENMPEGQTLHYGDLWAGARDWIGFNLNTNERKRTSVSAGFQWQPTDDLDIQLDITKTQQDLYTDNHGLRLNLTDTASLVPETDEHVVDLMTNTIEKMTGRRFTGVFNRESGLREVDTDVASLTVDFAVTDNLTMNILAGYSKTTDETPNGGDDQYVIMNTAQWGTAGKDVVMGMPVENFEKVGYDCTQGSLEDCTYFTGSTVGVFDAIDGSAIDVRSRFNPYDLHHNHIGAFTFRNNKSTDENKNLFVDFEYALDGDYITSLEFGAKYAQRLRDIQISNQRIENANGVVSGEDDGSGETEPARGFADINVIDVLSGEVFPYDNFAEDIQADRSTPFFNGWPMLSHEKAIALITGENAADFKPREDISNTRTIEVDTTAVYFKVNFEALDGALTGNIGVRYVEDDRTATGVGGIEYMRQPWIVDPYELLVQRNLTDETNPACPDPVWQENPLNNGNLDWRNSPANADAFQDCYAWQITHGYNKGNLPLTQLNGNPWNGSGSFGPAASMLPYDASETNPWLLGDADTNRVVWMNFDDNGRPTTINRSIAIEDAQLVDASGNVVPTAANQWLRFGYTAAGINPVSAFVSRSTSPWTTNLDGTDLYDLYGDRVWQRQGFVTNTAKTDALLPSLNLNYAVNEEFIVRFAASKTITRPNYDSLNPRTSIREGGAWDPAEGSAGNTELKFLESTNLDTSFEWYFSEDGMVSLALFNKDMVNFEETVETPYHYKDRKTDYELADADLLLPFDESRMPDGTPDGCHSERTPAGWVSEWNIQCDVAYIDVVKNGKGSSVTGAEFSYTDNYDFIPGLGASINYTYQESERDAEEIGDTGRFQEGIAMAYTPKNSANVTVFWENESFMLRLAHRYNDVQVVNSGLTGGVVWQDETNRLDLSSSLKLTENLSLTFNALNLLDDTRRHFYTYDNATNAQDNNDQTVVLDEGDAQNEDVVTTRTVAEFKTGRQFRIGIRGTF